MKKQTSLLSEKEVQEQLKVIDEVRQDLGLYPYEPKMNPWLKWGMIAVVSLLILYIL